MKSFTYLSFGYLLAFLIACQPQAPTPTASPSPIRLNTAVDGLKHPWSIAFLSENEALVTEKDGIIQRVNLSTGEKFPLAGLPTDIDSVRRKSAIDNTGFFDILLDPDFEANRWIYLSYAAMGEGGTTTKIIRAQFQEDSLTNIEALLTAMPYSDCRFHYGGGMVFGSDGYLYCTIGERYFNEIDQPELPISQNETDRRGKVYRLHPDGQIPTDNPDFGENAIPGLYALGIRASQALTLHPKTKQIWFSEHGTRQGDEINRLTKGANYGWPLVTTGAYRDSSYTPPSMPERKLTGPEWSWATTVAPTGLVFYQGEEFKDWKGNLLVTGLSKGSFWRMELENNKIVSAENLLKEAPLRLRKVAVSPGGALYVLSDEAEGRVIRISPI